MIRYIWSVVLVCMLGTSLGGQIIGIDLLGEDKEVTVPFEYKQGFIIVKFWLNGIIPLRMILDTGAQNTILFDKEVAQILGIEFEREITIMGSDLDSVIQAKIARRVYTRLEGCAPVQRDIIVLDENILLLNEKLGTEINGIIGGAFFANLIMKIDYRRGRITFAHPQTFKAPVNKKKWWQIFKSKRQYSKYPIFVTNQKPYLKAEVNVSRDSRHSLNLLLDTGASLPFLLHANTDTTMTMPDRVMIGKVGYGLTGEVLGFLGKSHLLKMGDIQFSDITTSFQDLELAERNDESVIRNGIIGNILLERFEVILDYTRQNLYLKPTKKFDREFEFDKSGMNTLAVGPYLDQFYVVSVIEDTPAHNAGIKAGDLIVKLNGRKAKRLTLDKLNNIFAGKTGNKIKITVKRGDVKYKTTFRLAEWYKEPKTPE